MNECYTCKHRGEVVGSAHSCCNHPIVNINEIKELSLRVALQRRIVKNPTFLIVTNEETGEKKDLISFDEHGVKNGWVLFPFNFDPVWLKQCLMYDKRTT